MKRIESCLVVSALLLGLFSCSEPKEPKSAFEVLLVGEAFANQQELKVSEYFKKIRYVRLETADNCLIGASPKVQISGDKIVITERKQCLVFDKESGRFITSIGHIGNDPQGSLSLEGWLNDAAGLIYFSSGNQKYVVYDLSGNFKGTMRDLEASASFSGPHVFSYWNENTLIEHIPASKGEPDHITLFRDSTVISTFESRGDSCSMLPEGTSEIASINVYNNFVGNKLLMYVHYNDGQQAAFNMSRRPFWHLGDSLYFKEEFNDTIYQVTEKGLSPRCCFDFGSLRWDRKDRYNPEKDGAIYPVDILENQRNLLLCFVVNLYHPDEWKTYNAMYNKETGEMKVAPYEEQFTDDVNHFLSLQPSTVSASGGFAQIIPAENIVTWFEEHADQGSLPDEVQSLKQIDAEDNPVVVIME